MELVRDRDGDAIGPVINASQLFVLPAETPYGNLSLKLGKVFARLAHANVRIAEAHSSWTAFLDRQREPSDDVGSYHRHVSEEAVFMLRRAADELVGMVWLMQQGASEGHYPTHLDIDSLDGAINDERETFQRHKWLMSTLNDLANAHKHSFVDSDWNIVGRDEPCMVALALKRNNLRNDVQPYVVSLDDLVAGFNLFLHEMLNAMQTDCV